MQRERASLCMVAVVAALSVSCRREERRFQEIPASGAYHRGIERTPQHPAYPPLAAAAPAPHERPPPPYGGLPVAYEENAWAVSQGKLYYSWFNCSGCHGHGGGDIGPPLLDGRWIYGGEPSDIFVSIVEGRPNGMPAYRGKIPDSQAWQIVAYVRSLSGLVRQDVASGRDEGLSSKKPESMQERQEPQPHPGNAVLP